MKIQKILTDNGSQFTDRFTAKDKRATGKHAFDVSCAEMGIEHRLSPARHPQTNGMVERFNGRISDLVKLTRFASAAELETTLTLYLNTYNHPIPQRALKHQTPIQALQKWRADKPELFVKRVYKQAGLDTYEANGGKNNYKSDAERVAFLFELYQQYTSFLPTYKPKMIRKTKRQRAQRLELLDKIQGTDRD